jgi:hypothetical protein
MAYGYLSGATGTPVEHMVPDRPPRPVSCVSLSRSAGPSIGAPGDRLAHDDSMTHTVIRVPRTERVAA